MGKSKNKTKPRNSNHHDNPNRVTKRNVSRRQHSQTGFAGVKGKFQQKPAQPRHGVDGHSKRIVNTQRTRRDLKVPFNRWDQVLLVGEGDFSFALSLASNHSVSSITATSFDSEDALQEKYLGIEETLSRLRALSRQQGKSSRNSANGHSNIKQSRNDVESEMTESWEGFSPDVPTSIETSPNQRNFDTNDVSNITPKPDASNQLVNIYHSINATALSTSHRKLLRPHSPFTKIIFNFPHTGGLSTDVNRQVRANQELLVGFFNAAKGFLATSKHPAKTLPLLKDNATPPEGEDSEEIEEYDLDGGQDNSLKDDQEMQRALSSGRILVTLFEGEPYTLWNIRDLARHCGLQVIESFKFTWSLYPGYKHARTVGDIVTGKDRTDEGKRKGSWRGEERDSRCYVLALKDELDQVQGAGGRKRREKDGGESDSEDD